jgi:hypothetical protein
MVAPSIVDPTLYAHGFTPLVPPCRRAFGEIYSSTVRPILNPFLDRTKYFRVEVRMQSEGEELASEHGAPRICRTKPHLEPMYTL